MPLKEEDNVYRQVGDNGVADIAADFEPLCVQRSDQLGRHNGLRSAVYYYAAAEFRGVGNSPEMRLLIGGGIGLDPEILQHRSQHDIHFGDCEISAEAPPCSATERQPC
jgi:hypothetical protein